MSEEETFYVIDGSAYIYRAFYAIRNLTNASGFPTNALYGFTQMLRKLLEQEDPEYVAVTFDVFKAEKRTFRSELYPEYKANRSEMPEDLQVQIPFFRQIVDALNIPVVAIEGVEADDVIATMTRQAREHGLRVCIVSADKDLMQLLTDDVRMIDTMRDRVFTPAEVLERFQVPPERVRYVMALAGDSSDNIPGVPGIGEKTGGQLIAEFGDLESVLANIDKVSGKKRKENLTNFADQARLSLELVTLRDDCEIEFDLDALRLSPPDVAKLDELFEELGFRTPLREIKGWMKRRGWTDVPALVVPDQRMAPKVEKNYRTIDSEAALAQVVEKCKESELLAIDLETTSLDPLSAEIVGIALSWAAHDGVYIPIGHRGLDAGRQLPAEDVLRAITPVLEDPEIPKVAQNVKYDQMVLEKAGVQLQGVQWDTMLMSYLLDPGKLSHGLDALAREYLRHETTTYSQVAGKGKNQIDFDQVDIETATRYSAEDADLTRMICEKLAPVVEKANLREIHDEIELPLTRVLARMEKAGIGLDVNVLKDLGVEFQVEIDRLQTEINEAAAGEINPNSPTQLREVLFDQLKLPVKKRTRTGPSTDQSVLEQLAELHPLPDLVLQYRSISKLKGTYVDALPDLIREDTGRIHTDFNQAVTATGRLSSSNPNLQNIPVRSERGREIRRAFVPLQGWSMICADYSQIELRIMAHLSQDPTLVRAFKEGEDIHRLTASQIFDVPLVMVSDEQRRIGKTINFGVMYGMGAYRLAQSLKIKRTDARAYIEQYFSRYKGVKAFFDRLVSSARDCGFAETMFGRRRILEHIDGYGGQRAFAERVAVNMPIQGSAADILKKAMLSLQERIDRESLPLRMLLQVHDELVLEADASFAAEACEIVRQEMEGIVELTVPLPVDVGAGPNWMDAK